MSFGILVLCTQLPDTTIKYSFVTFCVLIVVQPSVILMKSYPLDLEPMLIAAVITVPIAMTALGVMQILGAMSIQGRAI